MENNSNEKQKNRFFNPVTFKLLVIVVLSFLLLIPSGMIKSLINEREQRKNETVIEVTSKWGNEQTICGPIVTIPYLEHFIDEKNKDKTYRKLAHFLPDELSITGTINPETRHRGIYEVVAYNSIVKMIGSFKSFDFSEWNAAEPDILWNEAYISLGISDLRGINKKINITWNGAEQVINSSVKDNDIVASGITSDISINKVTDQQFNAEIDINGSYSINFIPLGKETNVSMKSGWKSPSFDGAFLPDESNVTDTGFTADWNILELNRNYPQKWTENLFKTDDSAFGVELLQETDTYQKTMRSVKYAFLFIALTFIVLFFSEVLGKKRIHFIYYLLIGFALVLFYSLLIALSEHIPFNYAYLTASAAIISLITVFSKSIFRNGRIAAVISFVSIALYSFLFTTLQLADYALLFGNIGLLIVLALIMYFSRKVDWDSVNGKNSSNL